MKIGHIYETLVALIGVDAIEINFIDSQMHKYASQFEFYC